MNLWPHQIRAVEETTEAIAGGAKRICLTAPTGAGKTRVMIELIEWASDLNWPVALYTNRRMLLDQTKNVLESHGVNVGMRASGYETALLRDVQLCMTQTELSQVYQRKIRQLHDAKLVLIDEAHVQKGGTVENIITEHVAQGAAIVGITATPLDLGNLYDELIVAAKMSDCFACNSLVPAHTYAPDEPDLKHIKKYNVGDDLTEADNVKAMMRPGIFGRVLQHFRTLNPDWQPSLLFAPGVKESIYFAEEFTKAGIRAAHIDGDDVWIDGEFHASSPEIRQRIANESRDGFLPVVCNRFVLREGIDWPWLRHGVLATVFGSLSSYIQSGGRLLRAYQGKSYCTVQDHGGNWWRHGSLNADRDWVLGLTNNKAVGERAERLREKKEEEPVSCPSCGKVRQSGRECPSCGFVAHTKSRMVVQVDGSLKEAKGDVFKPRRISLKSDTQKIWEQCYYRMKRAGRTFRQAEALFYVENHYYPPRNLELMPKNDGDWFSKVKDVPKERLIQQLQEAS